MKMRVIPGCLGTSRIQRLERHQVLDGQAKRVEIMMMMTFMMVVEEIMMVRHVLNRHLTW